jgi:hypothetical protein
MTALAALPVVAQAPQGGTVAIPSVMHFCSQHCLTFVRERDGNLYNYTNLARQHDVKRRLVVEQFAPDSVVIRRTDTGSNPMTAAYTGRMDAGKTSLHGEGWRLTWGSGLNDQPGTDEERDKIVAAQVAALPLPEKMLRGIHLVAGKHLLLDRMKEVRSEIIRVDADCSSRQGSAHTDCSADLESMRAELHRETAEWREEIDALNQSHAAFAADCARSVPNACDKLKIIDDYLAVDQRF